MVPTSLLDPRKQCILVIVITSVPNIVLNLHKYFVELVMEFPDILINCKLSKQTMTKNPLYRA